MAVVMSYKQEHVEIVVEMMLPTRIVLREILYAALNLSWEIAVPECLVN